MKWFRLYSEFFNDPKLKTFTKVQRHDVLALMSLASESKQRGVILIDDEDLAATLELSEEDFAALVAKTERKGITQRCENGRVCFVNFLDRQYDNPSDRPEKVAERKAKHDERKKNDQVTTQERPSNDTYSDTETENTQKISAQESTNAPARQKSSKRVIEHHDPDGLRRFYELYPRKKDPKAVQEAWDKLRPDDDLQRKITENVKLGKASQDWYDDGGKAIPYPATYLNNERWEDTYTPLLPARASPGVRQMNGSREVVPEGHSALGTAAQIETERMRGVLEARRQ